MSRYSVERSLQHIQQNVNQQANQLNWPTSFPKETIGIELYGTILKNQSVYFNLTENDLLPNVCEAIRIIRLKGYKVFIFFNESLIAEGKISQNNVDLMNQQLMNIFGKNGIFSIDGLFYATTKLKDDIFALPNNGMIKKAETDAKVKFKGGYFVGDKIHDLKVADSISAKPVLIKTGLFEETQTKLNSFANKNLKSKTKIFDSLLDFANHLS